MYVLIDNGAVSKYPYTITDLIRSNTQVSFPRNPSAAQLADFGLFEVTATAAPSHNALTEVLVDSTPTLVNGTWTQVWSVRAATAGEVAQRQQQLQDQITAATQQRLDDFARERGYDSIMSACTYTTSPVVKFATEGQYCVDVRALTWEALYSILDEVTTGTRSMPTGYNDIKDDLPDLTWP